MLLYSDFSLKGSNTFNVEAKADIYFEISDRKDLDTFVRKRKYFDMPRLVLGNGSNVLFTKDFKGAVLKNSMTGIKTLSEDAETATLQVASGEDFDAFIEYCIKNRLYGLENLSGIPGSLGGAVVQNAGAYGIEVKDFVQEVEYYDFDTFEVGKLTAQECKFGYRDSVFKNGLRNKIFIMSVTLKLYKRFSPVLNYGNLDREVSEIRVLTPMILRRVILAIRYEKIPDWHNYGSAGSFFKNPEITREKADTLLQKFPMVKTYPQENGNVKLPAGQLIDLCGFKNIVSDDMKVGVAKTNALIIVNLTNTAKGREIAAFAKKIEKAVKENSA